MPKGLADFARDHRALHPDGRIAPRALWNRCHERARGPLESLMRYCWMPALAAANASAMQAVAGGGGGGGPTLSVGDAAAGVNHTWAAIIAQLEALHTAQTPLFRFTS